MKIRFQKNTLPCAAGATQTWGEWGGSRGARRPRPWRCFLYVSWCLVKCFVVMPSHPVLHLIPLSLSLLQTSVTWSADTPASTSCEMMSFGVWLFGYQTFRSDVVKPSAGSPGKRPQQCHEVMTPDVTKGGWNSHRTTELIYIYSFTKRERKRKKGSKMTKMSSAYCTFVTLLINYKQIRTFFIYSFLSVYPSIYLFIYLS